jgi:hypothetical protein
MPPFIRPNEYLYYAGECVLPPSGFHPLEGDSEDDDDPEVQPVSQGDEPSAPGASFVDAA